MEFTATAIQVEELGRSAVTTLETSTLPLTYNLFPKDPVVVPIETFDCIKMSVVPETFVHCLINPLEYMFDMFE